MHIYRMMSHLAEDFHQPDIDTVNIPVLEGTEGNEDFSVIVPINHDFSGQNYEYTDSTLSKYDVSSPNWKTSSGKGKGKRSEQSTSAPKSKRKKKEGMFDHQNTVETFLKLVQASDQKQRLEYMKKMDACLDINESIAFAVHILEKATSRMKTKPENEKSPEFKRWLNKRAGTAAKCFIACYGDNQEHNLLGVESMVNILCKSKKISSCCYFRSKEEIKDLQHDYTRMAAELFLRWNLTRNQYRIARQIFIGGGKMDGKMSATGKAKTKLKPIHRINGSNENSLVSRTIGLEIWPSLEVVTNMVSAIQDDIEIEPENVRTRGSKGRFFWEKKPAKKSRQKKRQTNHKTKKKKKEEKEISAPKSSTHEQGCSSSSYSPKQQDYEIYDLEPDLHDSDLNFKW